MSIEFLLLNPLIVSSVALFFCLFSDLAKNHLPNPCTALCFSKYNMQRLKFCAQRLLTLVFCLVGQPNCRILTANMCLLFESLPTHIAPKPVVNDCRRELCGYFFFTRTLIISGRHSCPRRQMLLIYKRFYIVADFRQNTRCAIFANSRYR